MENFNDYFDYKDGKLFWKINRKSNKVEGKEAGTINTEGYRKVALNKKIYGCHRIIFWMFNGYMPNKIDHKNGERDDNRIENLRPATNSENQWNRKSNKRFKGVYKNKKKYQASIRVNNKFLGLGTYSTQEEAARAYDKAALEHFGEFARINYYTQT